MDYFNTANKNFFSIRQMEFDARRKENLQNKNQFNEPKISVFKISQGNLRINPFHFYIPINEARGKYFIYCLRFFLPINFNFSTIHQVILKLLKIGKLVIFFRNFAFVHFMCTSWKIQRYNFLLNQLFYTIDKLSFFPYERWIRTILINFFPPKK